MKTAKKFDCVAMKDEVQAKLTEECRGLDDEQAREQTLRKLAGSNGPVARLWRALARLNARDD